METSQRLFWGIAALSAMLIAAGCEQPSAPKQSSEQADRVGERTGEKMDQAATEARQQADQAGDKIADAAITAKVKTAIIAEPDLKAMQINVDTSDGVVTLKGTVDTTQLIEHAAQVAESVDGVKSVNNELTVKTSTSS